MGDHLLRNTVEDVDRVERYRNTVQDALFEFSARDGFAIVAAFAIKLVDR